MTNHRQKKHPLGLVSVTFRHLASAEILRLARNNGLEAIEWGGDVHVPHGDLARALEVGRLTKKAGLNVVSYGSYYRLGVSEAEGLSFKEVLRTAETLCAPVIRVWAGNMGSDVADEHAWQRVLEDGKRVAELAGKLGISVSLEFHGNTLNDTPDAARRLWKELEHTPLLSLWQPLPTLNRSLQDKSLTVVLPRLSHVHVFQWRPGPPVTRHPLAEGRGEWSDWFSEIRSSGREIPVLLEFVENDDPGVMSSEVATLRELIP